MSTKLLNDPLSFLFSVELENYTVIVTEPMEPVMESGDAQSHVIEQQETPQFRPQMPIKRFKFSPQTQGKSVNVNYYG